MTMRSHYFYIVMFLLAVVALVQSGESSYAQYPGFDAPGGRVSGGGAVGLVPVESVIDGGAIAIGANISSGCSFS